MNFAHLHLIINHIPIVGIPVALAFLIYGFKTRNTATQKFSLFVLFLIAAMVLPVYLSGEAAEKVVEHLPDVTESVIEPHEDAAKISMILTLMAGALSIISLWFQKVENVGRKMTIAVIGVAVVALISLMYTANLGGQIRHTELRASAVQEASP